MDTEHRFTLTDADGQGHSYVLTAIEPEEGVRMMFELWGLACGPLGEAVGSAVKNAQALFDGDKSLTSVLDDPAAMTALWDVIRGVNFGAIGQDVQRAFLRPNMDDLVRRLMHLVHRDGRPMRDRAAFSDAYKANYWELMQGVWEVIRANRFFPQLDTSLLAPTASSPAPNEQRSSERQKLA